MDKLIVICGPTASGKTSCAVQLAKSIGGEVISADSMQVYRELNIGTAKPTEEEMEGVPHHMLSVASVAEHYSVSRYENEAHICAQDIISRGKVPVVCGGTGQYINALISGTGFMERQESLSVRRELERRWEAGEGTAVMEELRRADPEAAARLHINDRKRVIRALEIYLLTGVNITAHNLATQSRPPRYEAVMIGIAPADRQVLYSRIDRRVDAMLERGLLKEAEGLYKAGLLTGTAAQAIGYKELVDYFEGRETLEQSIGLIKQRSRNYAKRQLTWFRGDSRVRWLSYGEDGPMAEIQQMRQDF